MQQLAAAAHVGGRVLEADDARHVGKPQRRFVGQVGDRASRHVVEDHRQRHLFRDRAEMAVEAFLRRLVVVGDDRKMRVGAGLPGVGGELDRFGGRIGAGSRDHRNAAAGMIDRGLDEQAMLVEIDGRRFAGRPDDHDARRAVPDMEIDELAQRRQVERPALLHRRRDGD